MFCAATRKTPLTDIDKFVEVLVLGNRERAVADYKLALRSIRTASGLTA
jgi:hypothetical protein